MPDLIAHIRRHTTLVANEPLDAAQAVAEWLDRRGRRAGLLSAIVLRSAARVIQAEVDREEGR